MSEHADVTIDDEDGLPLVPQNWPDPFAKGVVIPAHRPFVVNMNVNRTLTIRYRAHGALGRLSSAVLEIEEGP